MSYSMNFNSVDLSSYGLTVQAANVPMKQGFNSVQVHDLSFAYTNHRLSVPIDVPCIVKATTTVLLRSYLDSIRRALDTRENDALWFDVANDRYWLVRFEDMSGRIISPYMWRGNILFAALDPVAFCRVETTDGPTNIDADPKTITITTGGTARIKPVYTLTAGENLAAVTVTLENDETGDLLEWQGSINNGEDLVIDCEHWVVTNNGVEDMADVSGEFPELLPNQANDIIIDGFSNTGTLTVVYRNRYV